MWFSKKLKLGKIKNLEDITLDDMLENPIWVNDLSGEIGDDYDESSERPVLGQKDVTNDMTSKFVSVSVLFRVPNLEMYGSANYEEDGTLSMFSFWRDGSWHDSKEMSFETENIQIEVIPSIEGKMGCCFLFDKTNDIAHRI